VASGSVSEVWRAKTLKGKEQSKVHGKVVVNKNGGAWQKRGKTGIMEECEGERVELPVGEGGDRGGVLAESWGRIA